MNAQTKMATTELNQPTAGMGATDVMLDDVVMTRVMGMANVMASSKITVPKHLQGSAGDCFAVILQSMQWGMNPFAVAQKTHVVNGTLGYEAQLVNAVITTRAPVTGRLEFEWFGDWSKTNGKEDKSSERGIKVWATLRGENKPRELTITMAQVGSVRNSPLWGSDPKQQLAYLAIKRWSRLYCPDVILGVYSPDELVDREITVEPIVEPAKQHAGTSALKDRLNKNKQDETVIDMPAPVNFDLGPYLKAIAEAGNLEVLKAIDSQEIADRGTDEQKAQFKAEFTAKKTSLVVFKIKESMDDAVTNEDLDAIKDNSFKPIIAQLSTEQIEDITQTYESNLNRLNA